MQSDGVAALMANASSPTQPLLQYVVNDTEDSDVALESLEVPKSSGEAGLQPVVGMTRDSVTTRVGVAEGEAEPEPEGSVAGPAVGVADGVGETDMRLWQTRISALVPLPPLPLPFMWAFASADLLRLCSIVLPTKPPIIPAITARRSP